MTELAQRLKEVRKSRGVSQQNFAEDIGVVLRTYQRYENGERSVPSDVLLNLGKLGISVEWLLTGQGEMNAPIQEELAKLEALVNYWQANYQLLEANINQARVMVKDLYGEDMEAKVFDNMLPAVEVRVQFPHTVAGKVKEAVAVAEEEEFAPIKGTSRLHGDYAKRLEEDIEYLREWTEKDSKTISSLFTILTNELGEDRASRIIDEAYKNREFRTEDEQET